MSRRLQECGITIKKPGSMEAVGDALAHLVRINTESDLAESGRATVVLSGGNTPRHYLQAVADGRESWNGISVTLSDERFVPTNDKESNESLIRSFFLHTEAKIVGLRGTATRPSIAAEEASDRVNNSCPWPPSVSILGFGLDGHFASLFSESDCRERGPFACLATRHPTTGADRISMRFDRLIATRRIMLVCNRDKYAYLQEAVSKDTATAPPIVQFLRASGDRTELLITSD
ncbi:6-phosphogluconolactonase [Nisaea sp.]|uniref:6-phosphogluconolactonase n=1 Tax=Nisaea sp. TaxID=2024842 RepID=UPI002B2740A8|nr:6-phosphogluconolactonase [Nisaea sp.]